jgi:hypothetical protein
MEDHTWKAKLLRDVDAMAVKNGRMSVVRLNPLRKLAESPRKLGAIHPDVVWPTPLTLDENKTGKSEFVDILARRPAKDLRNKVVRRPADLRPFKVGPTKVGPTKVGPFKVGPTKVGPTKVGPFKVGPFKVGPTKVGPTKVGPTKVGPTKVGPTKVGPTKVGLARDGRNDGLFDARERVFAKDGRRIAMDDLHCVSP